MKKGKERRKKSRSACTPTVTRWTAAGCYASTWRIYRSRGVYAWRESCTSAVSCCGSWKISVSVLPSHTSLSLSLLLFFRLFLFPTLSSLPPDFLSKMWPLDSGLPRVRIGCTYVPMRDRWNLNLPVARSVDSNFEAAGKMARMHRARLLIQGWAMLPFGDFVDRTLLEKLPLPKGSNLSKIHASK